MISDKASKCPKCGCPVMKEENPLPNHVDDYETVEQEDYEEDTRSRGVLYAIIALLVAAIAGIGYWWYSLSSDEREVIQFVERFVKTLESGDKQAVQSLYPNADKAESFDVTFQKDSLVIVPNASKDTIDVKLSSNRSLRIAKDTEGNMQIVSSKGLFAFPAEQIDFAMKTGWIDVSLDDAECAERLKETQFVPWFEEKAVAVMKSNLKVTKSSVKIGEETVAWGPNMGCYAIHYEVVLENKNNCDIPGDAYVVSVVEKGYDYIWWADEGGTREPYSESMNSLTGKAIPKKGTVSYTWVGESYGGAHGGRIPQHLKCKIVFEPNKEAAIKAYEPDGKEYLEYMEWKSKQSK